MANKQGFKSRIEKLEEGTIKGPITVCVIREIQTEDGSIETYVRTVEYNSEA